MVVQLYHHIVWGVVTQMGIFWSLRDDHRPHRNSLLAVECVSSLRTTESQILELYIKPVGNVMSYDVLSFKLGEAIVDFCSLPVKSR